MAVRLIPEKTGIKYNQVLGKLNAQIPQNNTKSYCRGCSNYVDISSYNLPADENRCRRDCFNNPKCLGTSIIYTKYGTDHYCRFHMIDNSQLNANTEIGKLSSTNYTKEFTNKTDFCKSLQGGAKNAQVNNDRSTNVL